jgi:hypothetical protein
MATAFLVKPARFDYLKAYKNCPLTNTSFVSGALKPLCRNGFESGIPVDSKIRLLRSRHWVCILCLQLKAQSFKVNVKLYVKELFQNRMAQPVKE